MKPGNSVEDKTLTTRKRGIDPPMPGSIASRREGKPWTKGGRDDTAESTQCGEEGPEITMGKPNLGRDTKRYITVSRHPVQVTRPQAVRQSAV
jgi:hypothetical protein